MMMMMTTMLSVIVGVIAVVTALQHPTTSPISRSAMKASPTSMCLSMPSRPETVQTIALGTPFNNYRMSPRRSRTIMYASRQEIRAPSSLSPSSTTSYSKTEPQAPVVTGRTSVGYNGTDCRRRRRGTNVNGRILLQRSTDLRASSMKLYSSESDNNDTTDASTSKSTQFSSKKASVGKDESSTIVTEEMVLEALENAEKAWEAALEARKTANALIDRAEEEAEAASVVAQETEKMVGDNQRQKIPVTMQQLAQVDRAANASLDATNKVNRAVKASEEADRLEKLAENALQESERLLDDHLKAFPDSPLAEDEND